MPPKQARNTRASSKKDQNEVGRTNSSDGYNGHPSQGETRQEGRTHNIVFHAPKWQTTVA